MSISLMAGITGSANSSSGKHLFGRDIHAYRMMVVLACLLVLVGCKISPEPLTDEEQQTIIADDRLEMFVEQEPIDGPITLTEALERAIKYNLDNRLMVMEQTLSTDQLEISRFDMWPQLLFSSGYNTRTNDNLSLSRDTQTGVLTTNPFLSQDRSLTTQNLGLTWNILDFGVSYYQAKQSADMILIAQQRRRSVMNQIIQQVRSAYWRAATAEPLYEQAMPILIEARQALVDAQRTESLRLIPPIESLQVQKGLMETIRELDVLELDLAIAKSELAALMGLPPSTEFSMALPAQDEMLLPELEWTIEEMEDMALGNRPELIEERYQKRISTYETKRALLNLFPSLTFNTGGRYDSNSYLLEQGWAEAGLTLSSNLLNLANGRSAMRAARTSEEVATLRRLAMSMAALTQIHISYQQFMRAGRSYEQALVLDDIETRIFENINIGANNQGESPLQRIRAQLSAVYAEVNRYRAYSEVQNALANLYVSTGIDLEQANQYPGLVHNEADRIDSEDAPLPQIAELSEEMSESPVDSAASQLVVEQTAQVSSQAGTELEPERFDSLESIVAQTVNEESLPPSFQDLIEPQAVASVVPISPAPEEQDEASTAVSPSILDLVELPRVASAMPIAAAPGVQVETSGTASPTLQDLIQLPVVASVTPSPLEGQGDVPALPTLPVQSVPDAPRPELIALEPAVTPASVAMDDGAPFSVLHLAFLDSGQPKKPTFSLAANIASTQSAAGNFTRENGFSLSSMQQAAARAVAMATSNMCYRDIDRDSEFTVLHLFMLGTTQVADAGVN